MSMKQLTLNIQVFSDPICPWCYIGHHNLMKALQSYPRRFKQHEINWRVFMLTPQMPDGGMKRQDYLFHKFGSAEAAKNVYERIIQANDSLGINMRLDAIKRTPETRTVHQVIQALQLDTEFSSVTNQFVEKVFSAYFIEGEDIGDIAQLDLKLSALGVPQGYAENIVRNGEMKQFVIQEDQQNRAHGLTGVPGYLIQQQHFIGGAQSQIAFHRIFDIVYENLAKP